MRKDVAIVAGLVSCLPLAALLYGVVSMAIANEMMPDPNVNYEAYEAEFQSTMRIMMAANGLIFMVLFGYIIYLFKTNNVPKDKKALWAVVLFLGHVVSIPIFWYHYVWKPASKTTYG